jgi:hypothetical protein
MISLSQKMIRPDNVITLKVKPADLYPKPDYSVKYGEKYEDNLDVKEIAKRVRADIKELVKSKDLPTGKSSVKIDRFAGGCSLDVNIVNVESPHLMLNPDRVRFVRDNPHSIPSQFDQYTKEGKRMLKLLKSVVDAYNFDGSDSASDYFNVNFYSDISFDLAFTKAQKKNHIRTPRLTKEAGREKQPPRRFIC